MVIYNCIKLKQCELKKLSCIIFRKMFFFLVLLVTNKTDIVIIMKSHLFGNILNI